MYELSSLVRSIHWVSTGAWQHGSAYGYGSPDRACKYELVYTYTANRC